MANCGRKTAAILLPLMFLLACSGEDAGQDAGAGVVRPVKTFIVSGGEADLVRSFPGRIEASKRAELGFRVPGTVAQILVNEGDGVAEGQVLARIDPTDYEIVLRDRQATFDNAERNFKRATELIGSGNISRLDYDRMEANFRTASAAMAAAKQDLIYTTLKAPFSGRIAKRRVERFEEVVAKQTVFSLQQIDSLDVKLDLPESLVRSIRMEQDEQPRDARDRIRAWAEFEGIPGERLPLDIKEVATKADPKTQTFEVTLTMPNPERFVVLPGMTATVTADFSRSSVVREVQLVPATAVVADSSLDARVWVLDPQTMTVSSRPVQVGTMVGDQIQVTRGLAGGEEIVAVGASYMAEGMQVTRLAETEQAEPRPDDPR